MYALVPDDPVFFAKFQSLEEPLLHHLHRLHTARPDSADERVVADAYDSWVQVLLKLPLWSRWHGEDAVTDLAPAEPPRHTLYSGHGEQLTNLHPIELTAVDLGHLAVCLDLFVAADKARRPVPEQECAEPPDRQESLTDVFQRVMEVLLLPPPQGLLDTLRHAGPEGPVGCVVLPAEREAEYRRFCEEIVTILSSGDTFAFRSHRAMYL